MIKAIGKTILDLLSIQLAVSCGVIVVHPAKDKTSLAFSFSGSGKPFGFIMGDLGSSSFHIALFLG